MALIRPGPSGIAEPLARPEARPLSPIPGPSGTPRAALPLMAPVPANGGYLRRCTYRRVLPVAATRATPSTYEVACLYANREQPIPLGDIASARAICDACAATGIFRPDED